MERVLPSSDFKLETAPSARRCLGPSPASFYLSPWQPQDAGAASPFHRPAGNTRKAVQRRAATWRVLLHVPGAWGSLDARGRHTAAGRDFVTVGSQLRSCVWTAFGLHFRAQKCGRENRPRASASPGGPHGDVCEQLRDTTADENLPSTQHDCPTVRTATSALRSWERAA